MQELWKFILKRNYNFDLLIKKILNIKIIMTSIDFSELELLHLITHQVGNKTNDGKLSLSETESIVDEKTRELLLEHFLLPVKTEEFFSFTHSVDIKMNEVYSVARELFSDKNSFIENSQNLGRLLFEQSVHPKVKDGKLNVAYFRNVLVDNEAVDALGIFKSEKDIPFLKMNRGLAGFSIEHEYGFDIKGIDKGCLILNVEEEEGYRLLIVDNANKSTEAQYWKDDFLEVKPVSNEFHQTSQFLNITRDYITNALSKEFEVTRTDKIDLLNRSVEYFKSKESFDKEEFEGEVLQDNNIIESFQNFNSFYKQENDIELSDSFEISQGAVKKQARVFKSVIKLDKNFHIYVHGNNEMIEQGVDEQGRKYYKIYYHEEK